MIGRLRVSERLGLFTPGPAAHGKPTMSKTNDLADTLIAALDASPIGRDEKIKAIGAARNHISRQPAGSNWRTHVGPVGTGKKTEALRTTISDLAAQHKKSARKKR